MKNSAQQFKLIISYIGATSLLTNDFFFRVIVCLTLLLSLNATGYSQETWKLSGQIRHRLESANLDFNSSSDANNFNILRSRVGVTFLPDKNVEGFIQFQDSRTFGEELNTLSDGSADNIGRSFDGVILNLHSNKVSLDIFNLDEVETGTPDDSGDRNVLGAYGDLKLVENYKSQGFFIWQRESPSDNLSRYTLGFYINGQNGQLFHETEFAYQAGTFRNSDVLAFMFAINAGYKFRSSPLKPSLALGVDYLSGDGNPADGTYKVFDTLYATNHKYYGYMDFFINIPVHTSNLGLMDSHIKGGLTFSKQTDLNLAFHIFRANANFHLQNGSTSKNFGNEIDLTLKHIYNSTVTIQTGASLFAPGSIFKETKGNDLSTWFYLMTTVNL